MRARLEFLAVASATILFVVLAPVFWYSVEAPTPGAAAPGRPHAAMQEQVSPAAEVAAQALARSEWPLWSTEWGGGIPFHAVPWHGAFSPVRVLDLGLEPARSLAALAFANVFIAAVAMLLLCRTLEVSWAGTLPAMAAYAFSGAMAGAMSLPGAGAVYAFAPLIFWSLHVQLSRGERGCAWLAAVVCGGGILFGAPDLLLAFWSLALIWGIALCLFTHWAGRWPRLLAWSVISFGVALGIGAIQLLPSLIWSFDLDQPWRLLESPDVPGMLPAEPVALLVQMLQPKEAPAPPLGYIGAIGVLLALPALAGRRRRAETLSLAALCAALLLGVAADAGRDLPGLNPTLLLYLLPLPAALLAGAGASRVLAAGKDPRVREILWPSLACLVVWVVLIFITGARARGWLIAAAPLLLVPMVLRVRWVSLAGSILLTLLLFAELATTATNYYTHPLFAGPLEQEPVIARAASVALDGRVLFLTEDASRLTAQSAGAGLRTMGGSHVPRTREAAAWWAATGDSPETPLNIESLSKRPDLLAGLRSMDVRAVVASLTGNAQPAAVGEGLRLVENVGNYAIYRIDTADRFQWYTAWTLRDPNQTWFAQLEAAPGVAVLGRAGLLGEEPPAMSSETDNAGPPMISVVSESATRIELAMTTMERGVLAYADQWAAGWSATIDEAPAPLYRANGISKGLIIPEGEHRIVLAYRPWPAQGGLAISALSLLIACGMLLFEIFRRRPFA